MPLPSGSTHDVSALQSACRALLVSYAASVFLPLVCVIVYGGVDYRRRLDDANARLLLLSRAAQENASRVFELNAALTARTLDLPATRQEKQFGNANRRFMSGSQRSLTACHR